MLVNALLVGALAAVACAQSEVLTFTHVPNPITDGQQAVITYATNDTVSPVTILLRQGPSNNLQTVETLTTNTTGGAFVWTPCSSLPDGSDYALEIQQGTQTNYFGPFQVQGAVGNDSCPGASSSAASSSASSSASSTATSTGIGILPPGGMTSSAALNGSMTSVPGSLGTGTSFARNTTMSSATVTSTATVTGSQGGSGTTPVATASSTNAASSFGVSGSSSFALVFGAFAAMCLY